MYHGDVVPGFPAHPHRGFETVTIVLKGFVDHSDSHGAAGRYGNGDVQWMTAGSGLQHSEMFPLLDRNNPNPLELFQIWLNLPKAKKFANPYFAMLWSEDIPKYVTKDKNNKLTEVTLIAGSIDGVSAPKPAPDSWASDPENEVCIWLIKMDANSELAIPAASLEVNRSIYFYKGSQIKVTGITIENYHSVDLLADQNVIIENGNEDAFLLLLQGKPINEQIVQHGPFVMNSPSEIQQAYNEYRATQFGGWPWSRYDNVHPPEIGRFAKFADGHEEIK